MAVYFRHHPNTLYPISDHSLLQPEDFCEQTYNVRVPNKPSAIELERLHKITPDGGVAPQLYWPELYAYLKINSSILIFVCPRRTISCTLPYDGAFKIERDHFKPVILAFMEVDRTHDTGREQTFICSVFDKDSRDQCKEQGKLQREALMNLPFDNFEMQKTLYTNITDYHDMHDVRAMKTRGLTAVLSVISGLGAIAAIGMATVNLLNLKALTTKHNAHVAAVQAQLYDIDHRTRNLSSMAWRNRDTIEYLLLDSAHQEQANLLLSLSTNFNSVHSTLTYSVVSFQESLKHPQPIDYRSLFEAHPDFSSTLPIHYQFQNFKLLYKRTMHDYLVTIKSPTRRKIIRASVTSFRSQLDNCVLAKAHNFTSFHDNRFKYFPLGTSLIEVAEYLTPGINHKIDTKIATTPQGSFYLSPACNYITCSPDFNTSHLFPYEITLKNVPLKCNKNPPDTTFGSATGFSISVDTHRFIKMEVCTHDTPLLLEVPVGQTSISFGRNVTKRCENGRPLIKLYPNSNRFEPRYILDGKYHTNLKDVATQQEYIWLRNLFTSAQHIRRYSYRITHKPSNFTQKFNVTPFYATSSEPFTSIPKSIANMTSQIINDTGNNIGNIVSIAGKALQPLFITLGIFLALFIMALAIFCWHKYRNPETPIPNFFPTRQSYYLPHNTTNNNTELGTYRSVTCDVPPMELLHPRAPNWRQNPSYFDPELNTTTPTSLLYTRFNAAFNPETPIKQLYTSDSQPSGFPLYATLQPKKQIQSTFQSATLPLKKEQKKIKKKAPKPLMPSPSPPKNMSPPPPLPPKQPMPLQNSGDYANMSHAKTQSHIYVNLPPPMTEDEYVPMDASIHPSLKKK